MNLVNELQVSTEKDDVLTVLRKAKRLASKLDVTDIDLWLRCEQEGYAGGTEIPAYRTVKGTLVYNSNGYIPVGWGMIGEGIMDFPGNLSFDRRLPDAMSEVVSMIEYARQKGHGLYYPLEESDFTRRCRGMMHPLIANKVSFLLRMSTGNIQSIPDAVKDRVLDWACALERRGVLGENMTFSDREKEQAHTRHAALMRRDRATSTALAALATGFDLGRLVAFACRSTPLSLTPASSWSRRFGVADVAARPLFESAPGLAPDVPPLPPPPLDTNRPPPSPLPACSAPFASVE